MLPCARATQVWIAIILTVLLVLTRDYHFANFRLLPTASWAVFFLAGVYLTTRWVFPALMVAAALLDYLAVTVGGVSSFCISPAYLFLLPAYGSLWAAGRGYARLSARRWSTLLVLAALAAGGTALCEVISSGSFYFLSGRFASPSLAGFIPQLAQYFPHDFGGVLFYVGLAAVTHVVLLPARETMLRSRR